MPREHHHEIAQSGCGCHAHQSLAHQHERLHDKPKGCCGDEGVETVKDPVCGMSVDPQTAKHRAEHDGHPYYFCSAGCRTKFLGDPERYLHPAKTPAVPVPEGTLYTCPMHPEVQQIGPGSCPICGMALEPLLATAETGPSPELTDMTRRFWIGLVLTVPVFVLEMGGHLFGITDRVGQQNTNWAQLLLATPVVLWAGSPEGSVVA